MKAITLSTVQESVTWIIPNKPIYVQAEHMEELKTLMQGTADDPRAPLAGNLRPTQPTNGRLVRTNINFDANKVTGFEKVMAHPTSQLYLKCYHGLVYCYVNNFIVYIPW